MMAGRVLCIIHLSFQHGDMRACLSISHSHLYNDIFAFQQEHHLVCMVCLKSQMLYRSYHCHHPSPLILHNYHILD